MARGDTFAQTTARLQGTVVKAITGYYRLQDFVHAVRGCKTQAEERALVMRESAAIRTAFKTPDVSTDQLYHAVSKLLFIYMMGYPAAFGQVESLKMVASPRITEKRLGYLGSTQLIDAEQPTLTLITNSIKSDLCSKNAIIVGLALVNLATTMNEEIARDLADEVDRLLKDDSTPAVRKKAAFCAGRMVKFAPDLAEMFAGHIPALLSERNHAVVLGGLAILREVCAADATYAPLNSAKLLPMVVRHLQTALSGSVGYAGEYDVGPVCDPFLQVRLLQTIRLLADENSVDAVSDVLAHVASNTDATRNVGHAVLYETVVTIMSIPGLDASLRTMATNIAARLLQAPATDHNLRYVALALLTKIHAAGAEGAAAVARHRQTIQACLGDADMAIVRRAADLSLLLVDADTCGALVADLLGVLAVLRESAPENDDFRRALVLRVAQTASRYGSLSQQQWFVDTMAGVLRSADACGSGEALALFMRVLRNTTDTAFRVLTAERFWRTAYTTASVTLQTAATWLAGEYCGELSTQDPTWPSDAVAKIRFWASDGRSCTDQTFVSIAISTLAKLAIRCPSVKQSCRLALEDICRLHSESRELCGHAREMLSVTSNAALADVLLARPAPDPAGDRLGALAADDALRLKPAASASAVPEVFAELATLSLDDETLRQLGRLVVEQDGVRLHARLLPNDDVLLTLCNASRVALDAVLLQVAVPRTYKLAMDTASGAACEPGETVTQRLHATPISDDGDVPPLRLRIKVTFRRAGRADAETYVTDVSNLAQ